jgi:hypothetical protein
MTETAEQTNANPALRSMETHSSVIECPICKGICKDPRSLPCIHTFCYKCIESVAGNETTSENIECPVCRKDFPLPNGGISGLPLNLFVKRLCETEVRARLEEAENGKLCEACVTSAQAESVEIKQAELYCMDCKMRLCESCQRNHGSSNPTHTSVTIKNDRSPGSETVVKLSDVTCDRHDGEKMRLFCHDCHEVICLACLVDAHQRHNWKDVDKVSVDFKQHMTEDIGNLARHAEGCQESLTRVEDMRTGVNKTVADIESALRDQAEHLKCLIDAEREVLLQKLHSGHQRRLGKIQSAIGELQLHISLVNGLRRFADELYDRGTNSDVVQQKQSVRRNAAQLQLYNPAGAMDSLGEFSITYNQSSTEDGWSERNVLGEIEIVPNEGY